MLWVVNYNCKKKCRVDFSAQIKYNGVYNLQTLA